MNIRYPIYEGVYRILTFKIFFIFIVLSDYGGLAAPIWFVTGREERLPAP